MSSSSSSSGGIQKSKAVVKSLEDPLAVALNRELGAKPSPDVAVLRGLWVSLAERLHRAGYELGYMAEHMPAKESESRALMEEVSQLQQEFTTLSGKERVLKSLLADLLTRKIASEKKHATAREEQIRLQYAAMSEFQESMAGIQQRLDACTKKSEAVELDKKTVNAAILALLEKNRESEEATVESNGKSGAEGEELDPDAAEIEQYYASNQTVELAANEKECFAMAMAEYKTRIEQLRLNDEEILQETRKNEALEAEVAREMDALSRDVSATTGSVKEMDATVAALDKHNKELNLKITKIDYSVSEQNKLISAFQLKLDQLKLQSAKYDNLAAGLQKRMDTNESVEEEAASATEESVWRDVLSP